MNQKTSLHNKIYFWLLLLLAISLPLSIFASSVIQILLGLNWLIEGKFREKWSRLKSDKGFWIYSIFFLVHIVGMLWTNDLLHGLKDLKVKLPLLVIPFIIVTSGSPSLKEIKYLLSAFIAGNVIGSFAVVLALLHVIPVEINEYRNASLFISHIRFSLMIVFSIAFAGYLVFLDREKMDKRIRYFLLFALAWLPVFLVVLRSLSGVVILILLVLFLSFHLVLRVRSKAARFILLAFLIFIPLFAIIYTGSAVKRFYTIEKVDPKNIEEVTVEGNKYVNVLDNKETENGNYVWLHVCSEELEREWALRSDYPFKGKSDNGSFIRFTLIRYMTSKGLRKDAEGMAQLDDIDIAAIEKGIANFIYLKRFALYPRIYEVIWEIDRYRKGYSPNDKSMIQRYFYMRAGYSIAKENPLFGVGTGDVRQAFQDYYDQVDSPLRPERRRKAHNQYLTYMVAFGIIGGLICIVAVILPVFRKRRWGSYMTTILFFIICLSMLNEDTVETTSGVVMIALFYGLFVFGPDWKWK